MATIKLCDWTKQRIGKDEETCVIVIGEEEFEVSMDGKKAILDQLEGEEMSPIIVPILSSNPSTREEPEPVPDHGLEPAQAIGLDIPVTGDPFDAGPSTMPQPVQGNASASDDNVPPLEIPDDITQRLRPPSPETADKILKDSTKFEEGSLPTLTGGAARKEAARKLRELNARSEDKLKRRVPKGVNMSDKPGNHPDY